MVELIARSHTRTPPNFSKHAQMCAADKRFAQATTSCQPPQRLSARQHSCLLTSDGVWTSLLGLANNKSPQVCRHLQAQHNNAVHASLVFTFRLPFDGTTAAQVELGMRSSESSSRPRQRYRHDTILSVAISVARIFMGAMPMFSFSLGFQAHRCQLRLHHSRSFNSS